MSVFPQPLGGDRLQAALTARFLKPVAPALEALFWALRAETDAALGREAPDRNGRAYPYGCCREICGDVHARLNGRLRQPKSAAERALAAFLANGGQIRQRWGVLRDNYFQNALEVGSLYVDVSNDTVDVTKPKVEILPMREAGLVLIDGPEHFARIAERYWKVDLYANIVLPGLAPLFPFLAIDGQGRVKLYSRTLYMRRLFIGDRFRSAQRWLAQAPEPSADLVRSFRALCPEDILAANPSPGREVGLQVCRDLRIRRGADWDAWDREMCAAYDRVPIIQWSESRSDADRATAPMPVM